MTPPPDMLTKVVKDAALEMHPIAAIENWEGKSVLLSGVCFKNFKDYLVRRFAEEICFIEHGNNAKWAGKRTKDTRFEIFCERNVPGARLACMKAAYKRADEGLVSIVFGLRKGHGLIPKPNGVTEVEIMDEEDAAERVPNLHNFASTVVYMSDLLLYGTDCKFSVDAKVFTYI